MPDHGAIRTVSTRRKYLSWCITAGVGGISGCIRLRRADSEGTSETPTGNEKDSTSTGNEEDSSSIGGEENSTPSEKNTPTPTEEFDIELVQAWNYDHHLVDLYGTKRGFFTGSLKLIGISTTGEMFLLSEKLGRGDYHLSIDSGHRNAIHFDESGVYVGTTYSEEKQGGQVHRVDPDAGEVRWSSQEPNDGLHNEIDALTKTDDIVIYASQSGGNGENQRPTVRAVNTETGSELWHLDFPKGFIISLMVYDGRLFVQKTFDLHIYDLSTQKEIDKHNVNTGFNLIRRSGNVLYTPGDTVHARELPSFNTLWSQDITGGANTRPGIGSDVVVFGTESGFVHSFDKQNGDRLWQARVNGVIEHPPVIREGVVWIADQSGQLSAFSEQTGNILYNENIADEEFSFAIQDGILLDTARTTGYEIKR